MVGKKREKREKEGGVKGMVPKLANGSMCWQAGSGQHVHLSYPKDAKHHMIPSNNSLQKSQIPHHGYINYEWDDSDQIFKRQLKTFPFGNFHFHSITMMI